MCSGSSHCFEPDAAVSNQPTEELEGEIGSASQAPDNQRVAMATARASELPVIIVNGADSPRSRIGRGLESIGGMTAETLQRISTAVGGVMKSPVVLMTKVGGLASPRAATLTAPPGSSLEERVYHLEIQMKSLEERFNSMTVVTELDLSPHSHKEKPRMAKSLLQEMETDRTLVKRVQILENGVNERMKRFEMALSSIQSRLDHIELSRRESVAGFERQEMYYDAEQQSDNFGEAVDQNFLGAHDAPGDATGGSPTLEKSRVKETSSASPTTAKHVEPLQETDAGENDDFSEPQVVSTPVYSKEAFLTQPMKLPAPSSEPAESVHRDDASSLPASSEQQLASTLEELHGSFVTESLAAAASAKFLEIARAVTTEKSTLAHASSEPQSTSALEEPREAFPEEPSAAVPVAKSEEHAQEDADDKSGTPTFEATQKDFTKEPLAAALDAKIAQELATQGIVIIALSSSEPPVTSKSLEAPSVAVPSADSEVPAQEDTGDKSVTMTAARESPTSAPGAGPAHEPSSQEDSSKTSDTALASSESPVVSKSIEEPSTTDPGANFEEPAQEDAAGKSGDTIAVAELPSAPSLEEPHEESVKEFMADAPNAESTQVLATQEDKDMQVASPESQMASKLEEEPSAVAPSADFEEPAQEDVADKTGTTMEATESSLASSSEEPKEGIEKESMASAPSGEPAQEHSDMASANFGEHEHKADADESGTFSASAESPLPSFDDPQEDFESQMASKLEEEPSAVAPSADSEEPAQEDVADKTGTTMAATESASASSLEELKEGFEKESMASAPSGEPAQEHSDMASANFGEREHKADADESGTFSASAESPLASSDDPQEDFEKESSATTPSAELAQDLATQQDSSMAFAPPETTGKSKFAEDPSTVVESVGFEGPAHEDVDKGATTTTATDLPLPIPHQDPQEDSEKESLAAAPSTEPIHEPSSLEDSGATSDKSLASSEPQVASKFAEEPSSNRSKVNSEEPAHEDVDKGVSTTTATDSPSPIPRQGPQEDFEKETLVAAPSTEPIHEPPSLEDSGTTSDRSLASSEPQVASNFAEEPSSNKSNVNSEEPAQHDGAVKSDTVIADAKSPSVSSFEEPHEEKESMAAVPGNEPAQELATQEDSDMTPFEPQMASKFSEEPLSNISKVNSKDKSEEPADEDVDKGVAMTTAIDSPSPIPRQDPQEDFEKESLAAAPSTEPIHEPSSLEDSGTTSDKSLASSEPQVASKFEEEPSSNISNVNPEELAHEDVDKGVTTTTATDSPLPIPHQDSQEDLEKESSAAAPSTEPIHEPSSLEDSDAISDKSLASSEPQVASKFEEEPLSNLSKVNSEEPTQEDGAVKSDTVIADSKAPSVSSSKEPHEEKESMAAVPGNEPAQELATQEDSDVAPFEPQVASKFEEEPSSNLSKVNPEEPAQEDVDKGVTTTTVTNSPLPIPHQDPQEDLEKESLAAAPSIEPIHEPSSLEDSDAISDKSLASSEPQVASKFEEEPSSNLSKVNSEEPTQEDVDKGVTTTTATNSPLPIPHQDPQEDLEKESLAAAPSIEPIHEPSSLEDSDATSDKSLASSEPQVASKFEEEPSSNLSKVNSEEPTQEDGAVKSDTVIADSKAPSVSSSKEPHEEKESMAAVPGNEPAQELATQEDSDVAPFEPQVASKFEEEPSSNLSKVNPEELAHEDVDKGVTTTTTTNSPLPIPHQDPQDDLEKESLAAAPSTEPNHEPSSLEDSGTTNDKSLASFEPQVASKFEEEPSSNLSKVNSEEPTQEDGAVKSDTVIADSKAPSVSSSKEPHEEKESMAAVPGNEPAQELATQEDSDVAPFEPQVASKFEEEPSSNLSKVNPEEPAQEDVDKGVTTTTATDSPSPIPHEDPQENFEKESLAATPSTEPIHEPSSLEDSGTTNDKSLTSSEPQVASNFTEEPSSNISNVNSKEPAQEDGAVKSDTVIADAKSPSVSSSEEPHEEKESMAAVPSTDPAQELATQEDSDMAPLEPQVASKFVDESSEKDAPSGKFEEHAHENIVDKSGSKITAMRSPSVSSLETHNEDHTKESLEVGENVEPTKDDESGESPIAFAPLETPSSSFFGIPQEASSKEPPEASVQPKELVQEKSGTVLPSADPTLTSTEEDNRAMKESEYKLAEDFKVHPQHIPSTEKEFPVSQSNLAHVSSEESFATEDSDDRLESDQSGEKFFDVENDIGDFEPWESDEPGEATGTNAVAQKETLVPESNVEPEQAPVRELAQEFDQAHAKELEREPDQALAREPQQEHDQAPARELKQEPDQAPARELEQEPDQAPAQELEQDHESVEQAHAQEHEQQPAQEPEQEDLTRNSALALPPSESQVTSKPGESQELLAEEPLAAVPSTKFEEPRQANAVDESGTLDLPLKSTTEEPEIDSVGSLEKSLSSASFQQSGNPEHSENLERESSDTPGTSSTPQETLEREPLTAAPTTEIAQGHDAGKSDNRHKLLEPQLEESKEAPANEPVKAVPSSESTEPAQEVGEGFVKEPSADAESTSKSADLKDSITDEPSTGTSSAKLAQESDADKTSAGPVEDSSLTSIAEEPQNGSVSSPAKGKHVKIIAEPTDEIPRTQSDLTHVELIPEATEDTTKLESQGSFLAFGADSKEALAKEPLPSAKLLELFEEENNSGERDPVLADSPMTSTAEEPQKPRGEEPLASAKSVPKGHRARRRGFVRSSSEPQFAYKLEEHRKALAKESSVAAIPSASKLGDEHAQEEFGDTQCLPFRILGEGKHPRKESEFKSVEDVKSPATKSETASSPYVLEPRPSKIKLKRKKEKKERKPDAAAEEKERRLSLGSGEMERKSSLRAEEKDSKYSPRAEENHRHPFRHLRDRLRHAFSVNKEP